MVIKGDCVSSPLLSVISHVMFPLRSHEKTDDGEGNQNVGEVN